MKTVLVINGTDYSCYVQSYSWSRDDLDSSNTTRTKNGSMRRDKITEKRNLTYSMIPLTADIASNLDNVLHEPTIQVTYMDLHGVQTRTFYCSKFPGTLMQIISDESTTWSEISFNLHEI